MAKKKMRKNAGTEKKQSAKFSTAVTQKVINLLREDGKMSVAQIAKAIGKNQNTVYNMAQGKTRLSAEDYGKLAGSISSSLVAAIQNITMEDVKKVASDVAGRAGRFAKRAYKTGSEEGAKFSRSAVKKAVKTTGSLLQAAGEFIKALGGK